MLFLWQHVTDDFCLKSDIFEELTAAVRLKLQKYLKELLPVFTCAAALNPYYNIVWANTLIDKINET